MALQDPEAPPDDDPGTRALAYGARSVTDPAARATEDRVTGRAPLALARDDDPAREEVAGGGGPAPAVKLPSPFPPRLDAKLQEVKAPHPLRAAIDVVAGVPAYKGMAIAVADLSDPANIVYAGSHDNDQRFIASTGKVAILFAAFQLRKALREAAALITDKAVKTDLQLFDAIMRQWRRPIGRHFHNTKGSNDSFPVLSQIFEAKPLDPAGWQIDFATTARGGAGRPFKDRLFSAVASSDDEDAGGCTRDLGFPWVNGCLAQSGLRRGNRGLWLALNYWGQLWWPETVKEVGAPQASTARSLVELMTLLELDLLVPGSRSDMFAFMSGGPAGGVISYIKIGVINALRDADRGTLELRSKVGYTGDNTHCDAGIVKHGSQAGAMRYAVALLSGFKDETTERAARTLDIAVVASHLPPPA